MRTKKQQKDILLAGSFFIGLVILATVDVRIALGSLLIAVSIMYA